jgi:predicted enzyme related to lactoylglutathione lyase
MTNRLVSLTFDATDPVRLARFWASALGWETVDESGDEIGVLPTDGTQFILVFVRVPEAKTAKNPIHPELVTESIDDQREVVARLLELGAEHVDIGQGAESDDGAVLADPEGNEFCVGCGARSSPTPGSWERSRSSLLTPRPATSGVGRSGGLSSTTRAAM